MSTNKSFSNQFRLLLTKPSARRPKCLLAFGALTLLWSGNPVLAQQAQPNADGDGFEVLDRGPIHEAFAEPIVDPHLAAEADQAVAPQQPPDPINELPPEVRPEGANVQWIPGYWMWSEVQADFVWVSGVWRDAPPGRRWVPGHWTQERGGFVWSPGFWINDDAAEIAFLPQPPDSLEQGPSSPAPGDDHFWIPGCWIYQNNNYAWQPGYWYAGQPGWVWTPSYYVFTPAGYVFVNGYWDRPIVQRGFLYASVYWNSPLYRRPGFIYRPRAIVNTGLLLANLFVNPYHRHYYYGGFGPGYADLGFYRWYAYHQRGPRYYDPLFAYYRWHDGRGRRDWYDDLRRQYARFDQWDDRPGHPGNRGPGGAGRGAGDGRGPGRGGDGRSDLVLTDYRRLREHGVDVRTRQLVAGEQQQVARSVERWRDFQRQRATVEARLDANDAADRRGSGSARARVHSGDDPADVTGQADRRGPNGDTAVARQRGGENGPPAGQRDQSADARAAGRTRVGRADLYGDAGAGATGNAPGGTNPATTGQRQRYGYRGGPGAGDSDSQPAGARRAQVLRLPNQGELGANPGGADSPSIRTRGTGPNATTGPRVRYQTAPSLRGDGAGSSNAPPIRSGQPGVRYGQPGIRYGQPGADATPRVRTLPGQGAASGQGNQGRVVPWGRSTGGASPAQGQPRVRIDNRGSGASAVPQRGSNNPAFNRMNTPGVGQAYRGGGDNASRIRSGGGGGGQPARVRSGGGGGGGGQRARTGGGGGGSGGNPGRGGRGR